MTTIKPALEMVARAGIAQRTEALFRASGAFREGQDVTDCALLLSGYAYRQKIISNGSRQIISIHSPRAAIEQLRSAVSRNQSPG